MSNTMSLTNRELECFQWTAHGKTSVEISEMLNLSPHTVNGYLANICRKLNAKSRIHAVAIGIRANLIE